MQKPFVFIDSFVLVRCNLFQWFGSQFIPIAQRIRKRNRKIDFRDEQSDFSSLITWAIIDSVFNFSHNTVILVAMSDTWGINSPNTGDDKIFFSSMRKFTLCNEGWRDDDVLFFAQNVTKTIHLFCTRYVATIHATHPPLLNAKICYFSSQHSTLTALGLIFVIMSILNGKA